MVKTNVILTAILFARGYTVWAPTPRPLVLVPVIRILRYIHIFYETELLPQTRARDFQADFSWLLHMRLCVIHVIENWKIMRSAPSLVVCTRIWIYLTACLKIYSCFIFVWLMYYLILYIDTAVNIDNSRTCVKLNKYTLLRFIVF